MIKFVKIDSIAIIRFSDQIKINHSNAGILEKKINKLVSQKLPCIKIDLENIKFIDSAGFRILMRLNENSRFEGVEIILTNICPELMDIFLLLKLDNRFKISRIINPDNSKAA